MFVSFELLEGEMESQLFPSLRPWSPLLQQMGTDTYLLKGLPALLGGDVCTGKAGGRQPGFSPGLSSVPSVEARLVPWSSNT